MEKTKVTTNQRDMVEIENVNHPGQINRVDAAKYAAMKQAFFKALPTAPPGLTQAEVRQQVSPHLPETLFPGGQAAGWWAKAIQLDLEAKGVVLRQKTKPTRWHLAAS